MHYSNHTITIVIHLELSKFKYISNYMLLYVKILKLSDHLDIFMWIPKGPLHISYKYFFKSDKNCAF